MRLVPKKPEDQIGAAEISNPHKLLVGKFVTRYHTVGVPMLLDQEIVKHTEDPYVAGARRMAEKVLIFGWAGFPNPDGYWGPPTFDERTRRSNVIAAAKRNAMAGGAGDHREGPRMAAAQSAADHYVLTGTHVWTGEQIDPIARDLRAAVNSGLDQANYDTAAPRAALHRLLVGETPWSEEQHVAMAEAALAQAKDFWDRDLPVEGAPTVELTSRLAAVRVLMAREIVPITGDIQRGVELVF